MEKMLIKSRTKFDIPANFIFSKEQKAVLIIVHGFASSKESPTCKRLEEIMPKNGISTLAIDLPNHGENKKDDLTIKSCLEVIEDTENYVKSLFPNIPIYMFASSFGAFLSLLYINNKKSSVKKLFLRCTAVNMKKILFDSTEPSEWEQLKKEGFIINAHFLRPVRLSLDFYNEIEKYDLFEIFSTPKDILLKMVHGDCDQIASYDEAVKFSKQFGIDLETIHGADHIFEKKEYSDIVFNLAKNFLN